MKMWVCYSLVKLWGLGFWVAEGQDWIVSGVWNFFNVYGWELGFVGGWHLGQLSLQCYSVFVWFTIVFHL